MGIFLLWATWAHEYVAFLIEKLIRQGILKELEVCDFDKTLSACQCDDDSCCEHFSDFLIVTFSYNQKKTLTWPPMQFCTMVCPLETEFCLMNIRFW